MAQDPKAPIDASSSGRSADRSRRIARGASLTTRTTAFAILAFGLIVAIDLTIQARKDAAIARAGEAYREAQTDALWAVELARDFERMNHLLLRVVGWRLMREPAASTEPARLEVVREIERARGERDRLEAIARPLFDAEAAQRLLGLFDVSLDALALAVDRVERSAASANTILRRSAEHFDAFEVELAALETATNERFERVGVELAAASERARTSALWAFAIAGAILTLVVALASGGLARRVDALRAAMRAIATGEFDAEIPLRQRKDEFGAMARDLEILRRAAFDKARLESAGRARIARLEQAIDAFEGQIRRALGEVRAGERRFSALVADLAGGERSERSLLASAREAREAARVTAERAAELEGALRVVAASSDEASAGAREAEATMRETRANMAELFDRANAIVELVDIVRSVTKKTRLLSINASIEAAVAKGGGRGFVVVAQDLRALAARAREETDAIESNAMALGVSCEAARGHIGAFDRTIEAMRARAAGLSEAMDTQLASTRAMTADLEAARDFAEKVDLEVGSLSESADALGHDLRAQTDAIEASVGAFLREVRRD